ncbi:MAG TPA: glycosyltransferase [Thermoanaerobaculia bacterium]|nr:glycosyltransferase [Thermoanaerobaculia bacterium]
MNPPHACSIVANNYLAYARVFTRSFLERHPEGKVHVLIVDRPLPGHRYEDEPFAVTFAHELGIPAFSHFAFRYSLLELNTAVKPYYLLHLRRTEGIDRLCYFDPDILVTGDLSGLYGRLDAADAVLTPHLTAPLEDLGLPSELDILLAGTYNLGFLGLAFNERTLAFVDWWARRLYRDCLHEVERGLFVDQRWMDLAPSFLQRVDVLRDPGFNMAYWNLPHRSLTGKNGAWEVNGTPLRFFHFSGYDPRRPEIVSKYQNRYSLADRPDLAALFRLYGERIREEGHEEVQGVPYGYGTFDNGAAIPVVARKALRLTDPEGRRWPDPFAAAGPDSFFQWLRQAEDLSSIPLPRLALMMWDDQPALRRLFPELWRGKDRIAFAQWLLAEDHLPAAFAAGLPVAVHQAGGGGDPESGGLDRFTTLPGARPREGEAPSPEEIRWLTADAGYEPRRRPRLPRLVMELHRLRSDLQRSYPDPLGADRGGLAFWYSTWGRLEYQLPDALVRPVLRTLPLRRRAWSTLWWRKQLRRRGEAAAPVPAPAAPRAAARPAAGPEGINVVGWAEAPTGVGEACRGTLAALAAGGIPHALWSLDGSKGGTLGKSDQGLPYEVTLYHVNADMMETVQRQVPQALSLGRHRVGYWFWELSYFGAGQAGAFRHVDEVWAPSRFCQDAFRSLSPVEVRWMPPCVTPPNAAPARRDALGVPAGSFLFFHAFDALSVPERKNPAGLLAAFARVARECRRPVHLLLKAHHLEHAPGLAEELRRGIAGLPVTLWTDTVPRRELDGWLAACDAYVSLHRSEGLGLPLLEAMALGKPVIATGYGGVTDFLDDTTGLVVRHRLVPLERPAGPYPAGAVWAEPDAEHAAALMRSLAEAPETALGRIEAARRRVRELYAPEAAAERLRRELARIRRARQEAA